MIRFRLLSTLGPTGVVTTPIVVTLTIPANGRSASSRMIRQVFLQPIFVSSNTQFQRAGSTFASTIPLPLRLDSAQLRDARACVHVSNQT